jgi:hypothetical protein
VAARPQADGAFLIDEPYIAGECWRLVANVKTERSVRQVTRSVQNGCYIRLCNFTWFPRKDTNMTAPSKRSAAFEAVRAELISMVPFVFRSTVKPYITDELVTGVLNAALRAAHPAQ